jgi:hypothetical protein
VGVGGSGVGGGGGPKTVAASLQHPTRLATPTTFPSPGY